ncbi:MAG: hypothetical protein ACI8Q1_002704, partial [Parvicella sp.]
MNPFLQLKLLVLFILTFQFSTAQRYWVSGVPGTWSGDNWSTVSGGAPDGLGAPGAGVNAIFDLNGSGTCNVDMAANFDGINTTGYAGTIDINGQAFNSAGVNNNILAGGFINDTPSTSSFSVTTSGTSTFSGTVFGAICNITTGRLYLNGSTFNAISSFDKNGASGDNSIGGNTFNTQCSITNSGSGQVSIAHTNPDIYNGNLTINNTGTHSMYLAYNSAGNQIAGNLTTINASTGASCYINVSSNAASTLSIGGDVSLTNNGSATNLYTYFGDEGDLTVTGDVTTINAGTGNTSNLRIGNNTNCSVDITGFVHSTNSPTALTTQYTYIGNNGDVTIGGNLDLINNSVSTTGNMYLGSGANSQIQIDGITTAINSGSGTNRYIYLGNNGQVTFNGRVDLTNSSDATSSRIYCNNGTTAVNIFNDDITVTTTDVNCDGIYFGENGGSATLVATKTITIPGVDPTNFIGGRLSFRNFTQVGPTDHAFELGPSAIYIYNRDSNWGGNVDFRAPRMYTNATTYNGTAYLEKTGGIGSDGSPAGNVFVGDATLVNSGSFYFMLGNVGTFDDFQGNVTINNTGTHSMYLAYNSAGNQIAGNLTTINASTGASCYINVSS